MLRRSNKASRIAKRRADMPKVYRANSDKEMAARRKLTKAGKRRQRKRMEHVLRKVLINIHQGDMSGLEVELSYTIYGWVGVHYYEMINEGGC